MELWEIAGDRYQFNRKITHISRKLDVLGHFTLASLKHATSGPPAVEVSGLAQAGGLWRLNSHVVGIVCDFIICEYIFVYNHVVYHSIIYIYAV